MPGKIWRVEFDRGAAREWRKLGSPARQSIITYLREKMATAKDPRRFGHPLIGDRKGLWRYRVGDDRIVVAIEGGRVVVLAVAAGRRREVLR